MELWQLDIMGGIWLADGRELKAVTGIDDHSRFCAAAGLIERANAHSVCRVFTQTLARYGTPEEVLTDNGKVLTGRLGPTRPRCCSTVSAANKGSPPAHPGSAARPPPARSNASPRPPSRAADRPPLRLPDPGPTAAGRLGHRRQPPPPHQAIAMPVPAQRFQPPTAAATPVPAVQARQPLTVGPTKITRPVSASGLLGICYQQVAAGRHLAGHVVTVRLHPSVPQVVFAGQLIRTVPRTSTKEVAQLRAHRPHQPRRPKTS